MASQSNKKPKLVRDSFTIPKAEFAAIETLKTRAIALGTSVKKSELLRAGLMALQGLNDAAFKAALSAVPTLKTGRPTGTDKKPEAAKKPVVKPVVKPVAKPAVKAAVKVAAKAPAKPAAKATVQPVAKKVAAKPAAKKAAAPAKKAAAA
ncbi:MAG: hypothetical protein ACK4NM_08415 [Hydrogenophaga sp.]|jgi:hypothetical protein